MALAAATGGPKPGCTCAAVALAAAAVGEPVATAAAAIAREPLDVSAELEGAGGFARSEVTGITVATALSPVRGVAFCCAAVLASVADASSDDGLSLDVLSVDLPSPVFVAADLPPLVRGASVLPSELVALLSSDRPLREGGSSLGGAGSLAAPVSRDDLSAALSRVGRCEGCGSGAGLGVLGGSGWMLLSTSAAKLSLACAGSRPTGFACALE